MKDFFTRTSTALFLAGFGCLTFYLLKPVYFVGLLLVILAYILIAEWPRFNLWWLTPFYPVAPFLALINLYLQDPMLWAWLVMVVASYDTGGYIVGNLFGRNKIAPNISPGKTLQGLAGGVACAAMVSLLLWGWLLKAHKYGIIFICSKAILAAFLAFLGDLFESYLKRTAGLKDAGALLPGHGGILDRIDGLLLAMLIFDLVYYLL